MNENFKIFSSLLGFSLFLYGAYGVFVSPSKELDSIAGEISMMAFGFPMMAATMTESIKIQNIIGWILIGICVYLFYHKPNVFDMNPESMNSILFVVYIISLGLVGVESNGDYDDHGPIDID